MISPSTPINREPSATPQILRQLEHVLILHKVQVYIHWVHGPEDQGESADGSEKGACLGIVVHGDSTAVNGELIDNDEVGNTSKGIVSPFRALCFNESSEESGQNHDEVSNDGNEDIGTTQASKEAEIHEQKRGGKTPIDIAGPVDLTVDGLGGVGYMIVLFLESDFIDANTITACHGEVGNGGKSSDEGS